MKGGRGKGAGGGGSRSRSRAVRASTSPKPERPRQGVEAGLDHLFTLPLNQFTPARNALVNSLRKAKLTEEAERIRALSRPPISAWVVNQLYWRHRAAFDALLATGARFTAAQAAQLAGEATDIRGPLDARRQALAALTRLAASVLKDSDHSLTPDTMRRITTTLEALATYATHPDAPPPGRLASDVDPPGFEALASLVPRLDREPVENAPPSRVLPFRQQQAESRRRKKLSPADAAQQREAERKGLRAAAASALRKAERTLKQAQAAAGKAEALLRAIAARARRTDKARAAAGARFEKASEAADAARQEARRMASDAEEAAQAVQDAERALEKAKTDFRSRLSSVEC